MTSLNVSIPLSADTVKLKAKYSLPEIRQMDFTPQGGVEAWHIYSLSGNVKLELVVGKQKFTFGWKKHLHVLMSLKKALAWFYDESKKDMFVEDNGTLYFNNDYNGLVVAINSGNNQFIEIRPAVIERGDKRYEGIVMAVNESSEYAMLTISEFLEIVSVIQNFDFTAMLNVFLNMAKTTNNLKLVKDTERNDFRTGGIFAHGW